MAKKVWLDAGHGGGDCGAIGCLTGVYEDDVVLDIALRAKKLCIAQGLEVGMTRETDVFVNLSERARRANSWGADLFVSIHCNSYNKVAKGIEIFCYADKYRPMADKIYKPILDTVQYSTNRGVKTANYAVLRETNMSAVLLETAFIDNEGDIKYLVNDRDKFALGICKGILAHFGMTYKEPETPPTGGTKFYRVIVSSNTNIENARADVALAKSKGFEDAFVADAYINGVKYYRAILSSPTHEETAKALVQEAKDKGFKDTFIEVFVK